MVNLLDHYALIYLKWVDLLDILMVTEKTCHLSENEEMIIKCNKIWKKITKTYGFKLDSQPVYDKKYIKTELKTYDDKVNTVFSENEIPKEKTYYSRIAAICIDSVWKLIEENYPQVYLGEC